MLIGGSIRLAAGSEAVVVVIGSFTLTRFDPRAPKSWEGMLIVRAAIDVAVRRDPTGPRFCVLPTRAGEVQDHNTPHTRGLHVHSTNGATTPVLLPGAAVPGSR